MKENGNGRTWGLILFLAGLLAAASSAYVYSVDRKVDRLEDRIEDRLDRIEDKVDRLLQRR